MSVQRRPNVDTWYAGATLTVLAAGGRVKRNEHGSYVSVHTCRACGGEFTVCPPAVDHPDCLADDCPSYDPARDASRLFASDEILDGF